MKATILALICFGCFLLLAHQTPSVVSIGSKNGGNFMPSYTPNNIDAYGQDDFAEYENEFGGQGQNGDGLNELAQLSAIRFGDSSNDAHLRGDGESELELDEMNDH